MNIQDLIKKSKDITMSGLPFMVGRDKSEINMGQLYHIDEFDFLESTDSESGEFVVFTVEENKDMFYYGGSVITDKLRKIKLAFNEEEFAMLMQNKIEVIFEQKMSKNKKKYTDMELFPLSK